MAHAVRRILCLAACYGANGVLSYRLSSGVSAGPALSDAAKKPEDVLKAWAATAKPGEKKVFTSLNGLQRKILHCFGDEMLMIHKSGAPKSGGRKDVVVEFTSGSLRQPTSDKCSKPAGRMSPWKSRPQGPPQGYPALKAYFEPKGVPQLSFDDDGCAANMVTYPVPKIVQMANVRTEGGKTKLYGCTEGIIFTDQSCNLGETIVTLSDHAPVIDESGEWHSWNVQQPANGGNVKYVDGVACEKGAVESVDIYKKRCKAIAAAVLQIIQDKGARSFKAFFLQEADTSHASPEDLQTHATGALENELRSQAADEKLKLEVFVDKAQSGDNIIIYSKEFFKNPVPHTPLNLMGKSGRVTGITLESIEGDSYSLVAMHGKGWAGPNHKKHLSRGKEFAEFISSYPNKVVSAGDFNEFTHYIMQNLRDKGFRIIDGTFSNGETGTMNTYHDRKVGTLYSIDGIFIL